jgi:Holliday junction resolvase RusA-like endonuclease
VNLCDFAMTRPRKFYFFEVRGEPVAWERSGWHGKASFLPAKSRHWQDWIKKCARVVYPKNRSSDTQQFSVRLRFYIAKVNGRDVDNMTKNVLDALHGVFWDSDVQVREVYAVTVAALRPRAEIFVQPIDADYLAEKAERVI